MSYSLYAYGSRYPVPYTCSHVCYHVQEAALYVREGEDNDKFYSHPTGKWSKIAYKILHHPVFHVFDLALSVLLMLLALIEKPAVFGTDSDEKPVVTVRLRPELFLAEFISAYREFECITE